MMPGASSKGGPAFGAFEAPALFRRIVGVEDISKPHPLTGWRRKLAKRYLRWTGKPFDVTYRGFRLRLHPGLNAGDLEIVMHGVHSEEDEFDVFEREAAQHDVFVDIGANIGLYTLLATRHLRQGGRIISFEPTPVTRARFEQNLALNGVGEHVDVVAAGVGPEAGALQIVQVNKWNAGQNTLRADATGETSQGTVPVVTLEACLKEMGVARIGILKIDIEGFEDRALYGFFQSADPALWPEYLLLETCHKDDWEQDLLGALAERGYEVAFQNKRNMHFRRPPGGRG